YTNDICDASRYSYARYKDSPMHGGLSEFGKDVIGRMNELGMMVDVSHASSDVLWQAIEVSKAPIVATHSSARAIKDNARNLTDEEIIAIAKQGGVIQVATGRFFLSDLPKNEVTIKHLADHIDYIKNLVGIEYVGIGTDYDGGGGVVGMEDCSKMKELTVELLRRGYTEKELGLFWGGNFLRVWQKVIDVAKELQKEKK
ncbi:MAG: membrane dipeptidase, partial [Parabacteroides sp.]|nr:membrane dipeptidase [Parabacteroides sp.]